MDPERWERIRELFRDALERPEDRRAAWLRGVCANEDERREVESLLAIHHGASGLLEPSAFGGRFPRPGTRLAGRYELRGEVGRGGMAVVFEAWDSRLRRTVAVKVTVPGLFTADAPARFEREARVVARLENPSIVPVYDYGTVPASGTVFLVMPLVEGETLRARLKRPLATDEAVRLAAQLARALGYSHSRGVVHRDVKPENVLVVDTPRGPEARLMDFGLALDDARSRLTRTGAIFGTLAYMSPEQVAGNEVDGRSDLYALGTVLYECLAGRPPFTGSVPALLYRIVHERPPPLGRQGGDVDPELSAVVLSCLAKDPEKRPRSGEDLSAALESCLPGGSRPTERPAVALGPSPERPRWLRPALATGLSLALLLPFWVRPPSTEDGEPPAAFAPQKLTWPPGCVYFEDFDRDTNLAPGVSGVLTGGVGADSEGFAGLGNGGRAFSGTLLRSWMGGVVAITLRNLPPHTSLDFGFLFAPIDSWDGTDTFEEGAPDFFNVIVDGQPIFRETFRNASRDDDRFCNDEKVCQSYEPPSGVRLSTGSLAEPFGDVGFSSYTDGAYDMYLEPRFQRIPHDASEVTIEMSATGAGNQGVLDESWAVDRLTVALGGHGILCEELLGGGAHREPSPSGEVYGSRP